MRQEWLAKNIEMLMLSPSSASFSSLESVSEGILRPLQLLLGAYQKLFRCTKMQCALAELLEMLGFKTLGGRQRLKYASHVLIPHSWTSLPSSHQLFP
jgi:hypothetical protein